MYIFKFRYLAVSICGFCILTLLLIPGCRFIAGIKDPQFLSDQEIISASVKTGCPSGTLKLNSEYKMRLQQIKLLDSAAANNHAQPLQALVYNVKGELISFHVNCYAPGFPKLNWNYNGVLDTFPPLTQAPLDPYLPRDTLLKFVSQINNTDELKDAEYTVIIFWNHFMHKQSNILIDSFIKNRLLHPDTSRVKILYVNNDNYFAESGL
jgi:hypothetical protein